MILRKAATYIYTRNRKDPKVIAREKERLLRLTRPFVEMIAGEIGYDYGWRIVERLKELEF